MTVSMLLVLASRCSTWGPTLAHDVNRGQLRPGPFSALKHQCRSVSACFLTPSPSHAHDRLRKGTSSRKVRLAEFTLNDVVTRCVTICVDVNGLAVRQRQRTPEPV